MMQVSFIARGEDTRRKLENVACPDGINRLVGTYHADGGNLYYVTIDAEGSSLASARILARVRDAMPSGEDVHVLRDDVSSKFGELLYPHICEFERGIRAAYTIAMCAASGQFDDALVSKLETEVTIGELRDRILHDRDFLKEVKGRAQSITKDELIVFIEGLEERSTWNVLFGADTMPAAKICLGQINDLRNSVMHFHAITEDAFDSGRAVLKRANHEIREYVAQSLADVDYPRRKAPDAREALARMNEGYASALAEASRSILETMKDSEVWASVRAAAESARGSAAFAEQLKGIQVAIPNELGTLSESAKILSEYWSQVAPAASRVNEVREQFARFYESPEMVELRNRLASISQEMEASRAAREELARSINSLHVHIPTMEDTIAASSLSDDDNTDGDVGLTD